MGSNKRDLKAYVRYDGSGRVVAGSLILRKNKPKVGKWVEVQTNECCNDVTLFFTSGSYIFIGAYLRFFCNGAQVSENATGQSSTDLDSLVAILNSSFSMIGVFSNYNDESVKLVMSKAQKDIFCPEGTLTFNVID